MFSSFNLCYYLTWVERSGLFVCLSVCLFVCPEHNSKTNECKVFKLGIENDPEAY